MLCKCLHAVEQCLQQHCIDNHSLDVATEPKCATIFALLMKFSKIRWVSLLNIGSPQFSFQ